MIVVVAAVATAGAAVGMTIATRTHVAHRASPRPPLAVDSTAPTSIRREVADALDAWPNGTVRRLRILTTQHPATGLVRLELGLALAFSDDGSAARAAWRAAKRVQPDSPSAVHADDLLHPDSPPGEPPFVPAFDRPHTRVQELLARGALLQAALRPVSAEQAFAAAARLAPGNPEARVAAAVGLYDKDAPQRAFSQLGPLVRRFPHAQTVRFHLGLLLIYFRQIPAARRELAAAVAESPHTLLARRARTLLQASRKR